jgi:hypothetical protein
MAVTPAFCSAAEGPLKYSSTTAWMGLSEERICRVTAFSTGGSPPMTGSLSGKTMLTLTRSGVAVGVGVKVLVGVKVGVNVAVLDGVKVGVFEGVKVAVLDGVKVGVLEGVKVAVLVGVKVGVFEGAKVAVLDGVKVGVFEGVNVAVLDGVKVAVLVGGREVGVSKTVVTLGDTEIVSV